MKLLRKCTHTRETNESFKNCIWELVPETIFVGLSALKTGLMELLL
jgi:hypothetical protein